MECKFKDFFKHESSDIIYTTENIILENVENSNIKFSHSCKCIGKCNLKSQCECVRKFGVNYSETCSVTETVENFTTKYRLKEEKYNLPIYECNSNCSCKNVDCSNKLVQFGPNQNLLITYIDNKKGFGLVSQNAIEKGTFICEYAGEVINKSTVEKRLEQNKKLLRMNYILEIKENFGTNEYSTYIDPSKFGNIGRYLNHSCEPNCILVPVRVDDFIPKICIFAKENIPAMCELTFDYGETNAIDSDNLKQCFCNSDKCRKWLPFVEVK